jgi:hypothetical protein
MSSLPQQLFNVFSGSQQFVSIRCVLQQDITFWFAAIFELAYVPQN